MGAQLIPTIPHSWPPITKSQALLASGVYNQGNQSVQDHHMFILEPLGYIPIHVSTSKSLLWALAHSGWPLTSPCVLFAYHSGYCSLAPICVDFLQLLIPWNQRPYFYYCSFSLQVCLAQKPCAVYYVMKVSLLVIGGSKGTEAVNTVGCLVPGLA